MVVESEFPISPRLAKMETSIRTVYAQSTRNAPPLEDTVDLSHEALLVISKLLPEGPVAGEIEQKPWENPEHEGGYGGQPYRYINAA